MMNISELKNLLLSNPANTIRFQLPGNELIPIHAHVTEVARIEKKFIDCGGTLRSETLCRLQTWVADDINHRLTAKKLSTILDKASQILNSEDLAVDIEYEGPLISQFPLAKAQIEGTEIILILTSKHTQCLAPEKCCPPANELVSLGR